MKKGDIITVQIESLAFGGPGIARVETANSTGKTISGTGAQTSAGKIVIFVEGVAPGDQVEVEIFSLKRNLAKARVKRFVRMSPARVAPRCRHFGLPVNERGETLPYLADGLPVAEMVRDSSGHYELNSQSNCGGCSWQFLDYQDQLKVKENEVRAALLRIGEVHPELLEAVWKPIMTAESPWHYRNKMDFSFVKDKYSGKLHLGLHMKGRFREVTEVNECYLFSPWIGEFLQEIRPFFEKLETGEEGELKSLIVRCGTNTGEVMVNLQVENAESGWKDDFANLVRKFFELKVSDDQLVSIYLTRIINKKGQRKQFLEDLLWGKPIFEEMLRLDDGRELRFEIAPQAFLQPNTKQAEKFYSLVGGLAELNGKEKIFDLFCGTGTIGISLAARGGRVIGLELNESAVANARKNAGLNKISNIEFVTGDANKKLPEMGAEVNLIVVDPPRAGLTPDLIETITKTSAQKVIYVSCNPSTLARDLKHFARLGFKLDFVQAVDQFSQTYHVETVTRLVRI